MWKLSRGRRGASLATYGAVVGTVALAVSLALSQSGDQASGLLQRVAATTNAVSGQLSGNAGPRFNGPLPGPFTVDQYDPLGPFEVTGFSDPEDDPLTFDVVLSGGLTPNDFTSTPLAGGVRLAGVPTASGQLAVQARDPIGRTVTAGPVEIAVTPNTPPSATGLPADVTVSEGASITLTFTGIDDLEDDAITPAAAGAPGAAVDLTGTEATLTWTPPPGTHAVALTLTDEHDLAATTASVQVQVRPRSCQSYKTANPGASDGIYTVDLDGPGGLAPFQLECDMTAAGEGWAVVTWDDRGGADDGLIAFAHTRSNGVSQCRENQYTFFDDVTYPDRGSGQPDPTAFRHDDTVYRYSASYAIDWINPATGGFFTAGQLAALRAQITELSPETRMHAVKCDCDYDHPDWSNSNSNYNDYGDAHDARIRGADGSSLLVTRGACGRTNNLSYASYHLMSTDAATTVGLNGLNDNGDGVAIDAPVLPRALILPDQVDLMKGSGGGVMWGYEKRRVRVR